MIETKDRARTGKPGAETFWPQIDWADSWLEMEYLGPKLVILKLSKITLTRKMLVQLDNIKASDVDLANARVLGRVNQRGNREARPALFGLVLVDHTLRYVFVERQKVSYGPRSDIDVEPLWVEPLWNALNDAPLILLKG